MTQVWAPPVARVCEPRRTRTAGGAGGRRRRGLPQAEWSLGRGRAANSRGVRPRSPKTMPPCASRFEADCTGPLRRQYDLHRLARLEQLVADHRVAEVETVGD